MDEDDDLLEAPGTATPPPLSSSVKPMPSLTLWGAESGAPPPAPARPRVNFVKLQFQLNRVLNFELMHFFLAGLVAVQLPTRTGHFPHISA